MRPMTDEERMLLARSRALGYKPVTMESQVQQQLAVLDPNNLPSQAPMVQPYDIPSEKDILQQQVAASTAGLRSQLDSQRNMAQAMRGRAMPRGQAVGPSGIFVRNPYDSAATAVSRIAGAMMERDLRDDYAELDKAESRQNLAKLKLTDVLTDEEREYESGEAELDRNFKAGESALGRAVQRELGQLSAATAMRGQNMSAATASMQEAGRNDRGGETQPFTLDGKVVSIYDDAFGNSFMGGPEGRPMSPEERSRAVNYTPGTASGTLGDEGAFQMPVEAQAQQQQSLMGGIYTSPYFDASTGAFDPERWAGELAVGPNGEMVQATQSGMATATLGAMAQRMEEINLRPWTEKEIETITRDFPSLNSQYADWARFGARNLIPRMEAKFVEAIQKGRSTPEMQEQYIGQMYDEIIEGWHMNSDPEGTKLKDLELLGVPRSRITSWLKRRR